MPQRSNTIQIPLSGIIFFCLIFLGISYVAASSWINLHSDKVVTTSATKDIAAKSVFNVQKSNKPKLQFYVMSFCPYGNQMEDILRPVFDLIGTKADIEPHYIFEKITDIDTYCKQRSGDPAQCAAYVQNKYFTNETDCKKTITDNLAKCQDTKAYLKASDSTYYASLHGRQEANQDVRELCAWNMVSDKKQWWNFVGNVNKNCTAQNADTCWEDQAKQAGLDSSKITECFNKDGVSLIEKEITLTDKFKIQGSPTLMVNDAVFPPESAYAQDGSGNLKVGDKVISQNDFRTPDTIKSAICSAFNKSPKECNTVLTANAAAGNQAAAGGCGH